MRSVSLLQQLPWEEMQRMNSAMHPCSEAEVMNKIRQNQGLSHGLGQSHDLGRSRFLDATGEQHRN
jgi:hypothetical protein